MAPDLITRQLTDLTRTAWPAPRPDVEARVLAAMAAVRPRRHSRLVRVLAIAVLLLLLAAGAYAGFRLLTSGTLTFLEYSDISRGGSRTRVRHSLTSALEWQEEPTRHEAIGSGWGDIGPRTGRIAYHDPARTAPEPSHIVITDPDDTEQVYVTPRAGLRGFNGCAKWSPDESLIAFQHAELAPGRVACQDWHVWVIRPDGSDARQVSLEGIPGYTAGAWFSDSSRLLLKAPAGAQDITVDTRGRDPQVIPNVGDCPAISPDGSRIASQLMTPGVRDGHSGTWVQLALTDVRGGGRRVLSQQFLRDSDVTAHMAAQRRFHDGVLRDSPPPYGTDARWRGEIVSWVGPVLPVWSPDGSQIAFLAALPFDAHGVWYRDQLEVWVYDLNSGKSARITYDDLMQTKVRWRK